MPHVTDPGANLTPNDVQQMMNGAPMQDGIVLTNNGRSWVSVGNPLRQDTVYGTAMLQSEHSPESVTGRVSAGSAVAAAVTGGFAVLVIEAPPLLAVIAAVIVLAAVGVGLHRVLSVRAERASAAVSASVEGLGPRRILRGDFLPGPRADAADAVVLETASIVDSRSFRTGALGATDVVYQDLLESTWSLLWKLRILEEQTAQAQRLATGAASDPTGHTGQQADELAAQCDRVWTEQVVPVLQAHRELAASVTELDQFLDRPSNQDRDSSDGNDGSAARGQVDALEALTGRIAAALETSRASRNLHPGPLPGSNTTST